MSTLDVLPLADRLNRLVKLALDTGEAASVEEAERLFAGYRLAVAVGADVARSATHQAALLTIVNTGRRSLLGGIEVEGVADMPLLLPLPFGTVGEAVASLGGRVVPKTQADGPLVVIGDAAADEDRPFAVRATFQGWAAGIAPLGRGGGRLAERQEFVPSGVLAGALAVAEAFSYLRGHQPLAGRRQTGLSLWRPALDWRASEAAGPVIARLPASMWLIGLGNLGQAYLWVIGLLPYADPSAVTLVLQDFDVIAASNESTSLLTHSGMIGRRKARALAAWAERRGFRTAIVERRFAADFRVGAGEPTVALCGVDNALARAALEDVGFGRVVESGLGGGAGDFMGFRTHTFPASRTARDIWRDSGQTAPMRTDLPAYRALAAAGADRCGLTQLAGRTVGAPFVGATAATTVIGELLRLSNGAHGYELVDGHMGNLTHRTVVPAASAIPFNPGTTPAVTREVAAT